MITMIPSTATTLDLTAARQLRDGLATLLRAERTAAADFLLALADFDRRRGWELLGHASLFAFLHVELGLSKGGAFFRLAAARLVQRFPDVIHPLRDGRLCVTTAVEVARVLTPENQAEVLPRFFGCSAREAKEISAALMPMESPPLRAVVTRAVAGPRHSLPAATATEQFVAPDPQAPSVHPARLDDGSVKPSGVMVQSTEPSLARPTRAADRRDEIEPLAADLRRLHVTVSRQFLKDLDAARDGLSHSLPGATTEQVLEAALKLLLEKQARARGRVKRPRTSLPASTNAALAPSAETVAASPSPPTPPFAEPPPPRRTGPRERVPAVVRRAVWERDRGRCQWPLDSGGCCGSTHRIELDHLQPWARWGTPTVDGLRLLCRSHNQVAARLAFGTRCMGRYAAGPSDQPRDGAG
jgi:hypothetical protein